MRRTASFSLLLGIFLFAAVFSSHAQRNRTTNVTSTNTNTTTQVNSNK